MSVARAPFTMKRLRRGNMNGWLIIAVALATLIATLIAAGLLSPTKSVEATSSTNGITPANALPGFALPAEGAVFHQREEVFRRHGAAAPEIDSWEGIGALPETYIRESWVLVDSDSNVIEALAEARGPGGNLIQRTRMDASEVVTSDIPSGETERRLRPSGTQTVMAPQVAAQAGWDQYEAAFQAGTMAFSRVSQVDGPVLAVFSETLPAPEPALLTVETSSDHPSTELAVTVPYLGDLNLREIEKRVVFDDATHAPMFQETIGIAADGTRVVIESTQWAVWETLPASSWDGILTLTEPEGRP